MFISNVVGSKASLNDVYDGRKDKATASDGHETYISTAHSTVSFPSLTLLAFTKTEITCANESLRLTQLVMQLSCFPFSFLWTLITTCI
jgi:hypothetical protein